MNAREILSMLIARNPEYEVKYVKENKAGSPERHKGGNRRGVGVTRKSHEQSKVRRKMERRSRKINYRFAKK